MNAPTATLYVCAGAETEVAERLAQYDGTLFSVFALDATGPALHTPETVVDALLGDLGPAPSGGVLEGAWVGVVLIGPGGVETRLVAECDAGGWSDVTPTGPGRRLCWDEIRAAIVAACTELILAPRPVASQPAAQGSHA